MRDALAALAVCGAVLAHGCADPERERLKATTKASYDKATGKLTELTYDANKNGRIDTWTEMDGTRPIRSRIDSNEDGRIDRWEYYDATGGLAKVGFSRKADEKPDAWAYSTPGGQDRSRRDLVDRRPGAHRSVGVLRRVFCIRGQRSGRNRSSAAGRGGHRPRRPAG